MKVVYEDIDNKVPLAGLLIGSWPWVKRLTYLMKEERKRKGKQTCFVLF
jgi:hypothetical protein